jgi:biopolymer transport protein ExbB
MLRKNKATGKIWGIGAVSIMVGLLILLLMLPCLLYAQDESGDNSNLNPTVKDKGFWDLLKAGGFVGWLIVLLSVVSLALIIQDFTTITRDKLCPPELVAELEALVDEGQYEEALAVCSGNPNFFTNIIGNALAKASEGYEAMVGSMEEAGEVETNKLNMKIGYLSLLGSIAPMMGLLGTVTGMIGAFTVIEKEVSPSPATLAKGVYEALVTTCEGLFVAIPVLAAFFVIKNKGGQLIIEIGIICGEFIGKFKNLQPAEKT